MISHEARFSALHMTNHVPFYPTLLRQRLNFRNSLFSIVLPKNTHPRLDCSLSDFYRLGFGDDHQSDCLWVTITFTRGICDLVERELIIFANRGDKIGHEIIIIFRVSPSPLTPFPRGEENHCNEINAPKRPVRPFSARCENQSWV